MGIKKGELYTHQIIELPHGIFKEPINQGTSLQFSIQDVPDSVTGQPDIRVTDTVILAQKSWRTQNQWEAHFAVLSAPYGSLGRGNLEHIEPADIEKINEIVGAINQLPDARSQLIYLIRGIGPTAKKSEHPLNMLSNSSRYMLTSSVGTILGETDAPRTNPFSRFLKRLIPSDR